jgi:hypothetical protein
MINRCRSRSAIVVAQPEERARHMRETGRSTMWLSAA